jgi:hypothetical protein
MIIRVPVYGLMTKEKLEALVKQKNMQEGITEETKAQKEKEEWAEMLKIREENRLSPYEKAFINITNKYLGTNYTSAEGVALGEYERYLSELYEPQ